MPNHLNLETSPYLLQHAANPVDWYPWSEEALEKAHREDKPIFLSIGYSACHWCHVMAHESFEDLETARLMNANFINIKVDREERPDLDSIYMNAVVSMTGQGGWPMSVFLTPDGEPFYGGTYFPPSAHYGLPSFREVLAGIANVWKTDRRQTLQVSAQLTAHLRATIQESLPASISFEPADLSTAAQTLIESYDWEHGGWGHAPRFPAPMTVEFLLQQGSRGNNAALKVACHLLKVMQRGGMADLVGGGFHRYSTDDGWLVPHFEKMLYDNAQLASVYLHAYWLTADPDFRRICEETLDFILREMTHPGGGFYSSLDADSEGEEGKYYLWTLAEIKSALPEPADQAFFFRVYPASLRGHFEGKIILQKPAELEPIFREMGLSADIFQERLAACHRRLFDLRSHRIRPHTDDKILTAWNAFTLKVLAEAGSGLENAVYLDAAKKNAAFLLSHLYSDGKLLRSWREGTARTTAYLEDYAALALGLQALYQADRDTKWVQWADRLVGELLAGFSDPSGGFFDTRVGESELLIRPKDIQDNATPSGNALAALAILKQSALTGNFARLEDLDRWLAAVKELSLKYPASFSFWLQAADFLIGPVQQVALTWPETTPPPQDYFRLLAQAYRPRTVVAAASYPITGFIPELLVDRAPRDGRPTAFVCQNFVCNLPVTRQEDLRSQLT